MSKILGYKYNQADLKKARKEQFRYFIKDQQKYWIEIMQTFKELFDVTLGVWETDTVDL